MKIRKATLEDIPELCELLSLLFEQESEFKPDTESQIHGLKQILENPSIGEILVLSDGREIVAMLNLLYTISTALGARVAILEDVVVRTEFRGQGIGSKLIDFAIQFARSAACKRITLQTDGDNFRAQNFYEKHGFEASSMRTYRMLLD